MKKLIERLIGIILVVILAFSMVGCMEKRAYEKGFKKFEEYVYDEYSNFVDIAATTIDPKDKTMYCLVFLSEDYNPAPDHPEYQIADRFMYMFNTYSKEHPGDLPGDDYRICIEMYDRKGIIWVPIAKITNYVYDTDTMNKVDEAVEIYPQLCSVKFYVSANYKKLLCKDDIVYLNIWEQIGMPDGISVSYLQDSLVEFANLRYIRIGYADPDGEVWTMLDESYPDLIRI